MKEHENIVLCGYPVQFLLILENFCINRKLNLKKVSLYKPPLTPFWPCPAKQQGIFLSCKQTSAMHQRGPKRRQKLTKARQSTVHRSKMELKWFVCLHIQLLLFVRVLQILASLRRKQGPYWFSNALWPTNNPNGTLISLSSYLLYRRGWKTFGYLISRAASGSVY